jgi:predicted HAD superfamily Cof-like phosphohydrolase
MNKSTIEQVLEFHNAFGVSFHLRPHLSDESTNRLRVDLIREETFELERALANRDAVGVLDALTDLQYVLDGAYLAFGFAGVKEEAFCEVHASNMSKLDAVGKPIRRADGKVLKGPYYRKPELQAIVESLKDARIV